MTSGRLGPRWMRLDLPASPATAGPTLAAATDPSVNAPLCDDRLTTAIRRTRDFLLARQHPEGHWVGELEGDTILESEYILLLAFLRRESSDAARQCANYLVGKQQPEGGWAIYPGGPLEISASVKAYFALKLTGHPPDAEHMLRAKSAIRAAGGAERVNSFTRYYLALLGVISYEQCPAVPPELMLIPKWLPFNIYEMSAWSRTILVPLSLLWAFRPVRTLPPESRIDELFLKRPQDLPVTMGPSETRDTLRRKSWINWERFFGRLDRAIKLLERLRLRPLRGIAVRKAARWMIERFQHSDGLGAIFPPIIWSVVALKCLGHDDDAPLVQAQFGELERLFLRDGETIRLQPCQSPVWDTAISVIALREAGVAASHPSLRRAADWLLAKEVRRPGDWTVRNSKGQIGGWFFEFNNEFYPDIDDTCMVIMALSRCLPDEAAWSADFLFEPWSPHEADRDAAAVVAGRGDSAEDAARRVESSAPILGAIWRGTRWILAMQNRDGGWGAFDRNNDRELFTRVPFADHNAMIDPSSVDLTSRMLEMFARLGLSRKHPVVERSIEYVWHEQERDHCWYGRWGVNYIYGTWQTLVGLAAIGVPIGDPRVLRAAEWLKSKQQPDGGWGETPGSYDDPALRGQGPVTASQTAWALMGLLAAGENASEAVRRGVEFLLDTQKADGTWDEPWFTGTGFPRVFYLKYHFYRVYFPLMALGRYHRLR